MKQIVIAIAIDALASPIFKTLPEFDSPGAFEFPERPLCKAYVPWLYGLVGVFTQDLTKRRPG